MLLFFKTVLIAILLFLTTVVESKSRTSLHTITIHLSYSECAPSLRFSRREGVTKSLRFKIKIYRHRRGESTTGFQTHISKSNRNSEVYANLQPIPKACPTTGGSSNSQILKLKSFSNYQIIKSLNHQIEIPPNRHIISTSLPFPFHFTSTRSSCPTSFTSKNPTNNQSFKPDNIYCRQGLQISSSLSTSPTRFQVVHKIPVFRYCFWGIPILSCTNFNQAIVLNF
jgi:hypothetical protein